MPLDRRRRDRQVVSGLFDRQPAKVTKLDDLRRRGGRLGQFGQRFVDGDQIQFEVDADVRRFVERCGQLSAVALGGTMLARVIDENAAHHLRRRAIEMDPILELS